MLIPKGLLASTTNPINTSRDEHAGRPPMSPSEKNNSNGISNNVKKPKSRIVTSRYLSPSTSNSSSASRRCPSPSVPRNSTPVCNAHSLGSKRAVSVGRRRPEPLAPYLDPKHGNAADVSAKSLSVSFQGEAFSLPIKGHPERRRSNTPLRGKAEGVGVQVENSKPSDRHRWPARIRLADPLSKSLDCSCTVGERSELIGTGNAILAFQQLIVDERRPLVDCSVSLDLGHSELPMEAQRAPDGNSFTNEASMPSDQTTSDSDSVSSGSTSGVQDCTRASHRQNRPRGLVSFAKFWQETNSRLRRLQDPPSPFLTSPGPNLTVLPKMKYHISNGQLSSPKTMSSPIRGGIRPVTPSKLMNSPSRIRNVVSTINNKFMETPSVLSFSVDVRKGTVGENRIIDAYLLRLLYNRHLQWRFVNARTKALLLVQKHRAEKNLWNSWITISKLRDTVTKRRHKLQLLRQKLKLASILKGQTKCLEDWASVDEDHSISLLGATEALTGSSLRLPVVGGATANIQSLQDAFGSAVDIMQTITSSTRLLLPMVQEVNSLVSELAKVTTKEQALLEQCTEFIYLLAAIQVKDSSLRTYILQRNCV